jgi:nucleotide-binding universal stress UspA family protein
LAARAGEVGIERFVPAVMAENRPMLGVFQDVGFEVSRELEGGEVEVSFPIQVTEAYRERVAVVRGHGAGLASVAARGATTGRCTGAPSAASGQDTTVAFRRVVLGYDGSDAARRALDRLPELVDQGAEVTIVTAVKRTVTSLGPMLPDPADVEEQRRKLDEAWEALRARGIRARSVEPAGDAAERIVEEADRVDADVIVVGRHGKSLPARLLLGSVSEKVLRSTHRDVLVVQ